MDQSPTNLKIKMLTEPSPPLEFSIQKHPWETTDVAPDKPEGFEYGYVLKDKAHGCTKQGLLDYIATNGKEITLVWTPETPEAVRPSEVDFLFSAFKKRAEKAARKTILIGLGILAGGIVVLVIFAQWTLAFRNLFVVFGTLVLAEGLWEWHKTKSFSVADLEAEADMGKFAGWLKKKSLSRYTACVFAAIIVVELSQLLFGEKESIATAGLVKPAVWQGQVWRLTSAMLMHVNFTHLWMNCLGLFAIGKVIEYTIHRRVVPLVFFISGLSGSVFSLVLYPHTTSVGASGGIMGLLGFLTVEVWLHREKYPANYFRRVVEGVAFTGVLGVIGFLFIDNAAHFGGLLGGVGLGLLFQKARVEYSGRVLSLLSVVSIALLFISALFTSNKLLKLL